MSDTVEIAVSNGAQYIESLGPSQSHKTDEADISTQTAKKRGADEIESEILQPSSSRPRLHSSSASKDAKSTSSSKKAKDRWRIHKMNDDYVNLVGDIMYPRTELGPYGYDPQKGRFPFDRINTLGFLLSPLRRPTVIEKWNPYEISIFEAALTLHGKNFHRVQSYIRTKTVKEVIEFYYDWKKTTHYKQWKDSYRPDDRETDK